MPPRRSSQRSSRSDDPTAHLIRHIDEAPVRIIPLLDIRARRHGDLRPPDPQTTALLAVSIARFGLLQPPVVDRDLALLAGGQRRAAMLAIGSIAERDRYRHVLNEAMAAQVDAFALIKDIEADRAELLRWWEQCGGTIPVRVMTQSSEDRRWAKAIETLENTNRNNRMTPEEQDRIANFVLECHAEEDYSTGRPRRGSSTPSTDFQIITGLSRATFFRTIERLRNGAPAPAPPTRPSERERLRRALGRFLDSREAAGEPELCRELRSVLEQLSE